MKPATNFSRRGLLAASSAAAFSAASGLAVAAPPRWRKIWNGVDLQGWTTWGGIPHKSQEGLGLKRNPDGTYAEPLGAGKDPRGVYSVVTLQGKRVLRISGELFGGMLSTESFSNYHLYVKWRWGDLRWEPRATA